MSTAAEPGPGEHGDAPAVRLVRLTLPALAALAAGDRDTASEALGQPVTDFFASDSQWLWRMRFAQVVADPESLDWIARAGVSDPHGIVGHAGFHGPPGSTGMVEVGYSVDPAFRHRGFARAMLRLLVERARAEPAVRTLRATISPGNVSSLGTIAGFGFVRVGEQEDPEDGLEIIFEIDVSHQNP